MAVEFPVSKGLPRRRTDLTRSSVPFYNEAETAADPSPEIERAMQSLDAPGSC